MTGTPGLAERGPVATAIHYARQRLGITRRALALRSGLSQPYVSKLEAGLQPSLLAFARLALTLKLSPLEVWAVVMAEATHASRNCPRCGGVGEVSLPRGDELVEEACPLCRPWPTGFPGESANGRWIIPPYERGDTEPLYYPLGEGPPIRETGG